MMIKLFSFIIGAALFFSSAFAQSHYDKHIISGTVTDSESGKALRNVNVYIAHSLLGTTTDDKGKFLISDLENGHYKVIVSCIGYHTMAADVRISNSSVKNLFVKLETKIYELPTVSVVDKDADEWRHNLRTFIEEFIGNTKNAEKTKIEDPYILEFKTNEHGDLTASAQKPVVIYNYALGYRITYFLDKFITNGITTKFNGLPVFEELKPADQNEKQEWDINRKETYLTSLRYFLKTICDNYSKSWIWLRDQGFQVTSNRITVTIHEYIKPGEIESEMYLTFQDYWDIRYKYPELDSKFESLSYRARINLHADSVYVDKRGRYYDEFKIQTFGEWALHRLADMLPYEYSLDGIVIKKE